MCSHKVHTTNNNHSVFKIYYINFKRKQVNIFYFILFINEKRHVRFHKLYQKNKIHFYLMPTKNKNKRV